MQGTVTPPLLPAPRQRAMPSQPNRRRTKPQTTAARQTAFQPIGEKRKSRKPEAAGPTKRTENSPFCTTKSLVAAAKRPFPCVQKPLKPLKRQYSNEPFPAIFLYKTHESLPISDKEKQVRQLKLRKYGKRRPERKGIQKEISALAAIGKLPVAANTLNDSHAASRCFMRKSTCLRPLSLHLIRQEDALP